ncbi:unnamed protein product [Rhizoctonia solani]|uniref:Uncharacterized protein n=1 Tax=Rhizoctonia solani TaxID=456999 RepID=A0A8H2XLL9_9AGAM|nr:unnamed protein product [Rhizoctonia solani]CAE6470384.1 unnamed protein product [Rhizoctonia solani]
MVKKFLESKNAEILLAAQVIDSSESVRMKRPQLRPNERQTNSKRKTSGKSHKLDIAKLAVKQQEKNRKLVRKKLRRSENGVKNPEIPAPSVEERPSGARSNVASLDAQLSQDRRVKRVSFA